MAGGELPLLTQEDLEDVTIRYQAELTKDQVRILTTFLEMLWMYPGYEYVFQAVSWRFIDGFCPGPDAVASDVKWCHMGWCWPCRSCRWCLVTSWMLSVDISRPCEALIFQSTGAQSVVHGCFRFQDVDQLTHAPRYSLEFRLLLRQLPEAKWGQRGHSETLDAAGGPRMWGLGPQRGPEHGWPCGARRLRPAAASCGYHRYLGCLKELWHAKLIQAIPRLWRRKETRHAGEGFLHIAQHEQLKELDS